MREYRYLTHDDRLLIEKLYARGIAPSDIASVVGVSLATIYRELPRGYTDERFPGGRKVYSAAKAQQTVDQNIKRRGRSPADTKKGTESSTRPQQCEPHCRHVLYRHNERCYVHVTVAPVFSPDGTNPRYGNRCL